MGMIRLMGRRLPSKSKGKKADNGGNMEMGTYKTIEIEPDRILADGKEMFYLDKEYNVWKDTRDSMIWYSEIYCH
jgi:hypothetical protein